MEQQILDRKQKIEIPLVEYNLLKEIYRQSRRQALLLRIMEAEENLKRKRVKKTNINKFTDKII